MGNTSDVHRPTHTQLHTTSQFYMFVLYLVKASTIQHQISLPETSVCVWPPNSPDLSPVWASCTNMSTSSPYSANRNCLTVPRCRLSTYGCPAFDYVGPTVWNSLPDELRNSDSFDSFKLFMKTILFSRY